MSTLIGEWERWALLGWFDIVSRYRRTFLGPLWIVLLTLISVSSIGFVYSSIFRIPVREFLPFVGIGIIVWTWLSTVLIESCSAFTAYKFILLNHRVDPTSVLVRIVSRDLYIFFHNSLVVLLLLLFFRNPLNWNVVYVIPGIVMICAIIFSTGVLLAFLCARFHDIAQLVISFMGLLFMVTPVIWKPQVLGARAYIADWNPFTHIIALVREPLLGSPPGLDDWLAAMSVLLIFSFSCLANEADVQCASYTMGLKNMAEILLERVGLTFPKSYGSSNSLRAILGQRLFQKNIQSKEIQALSDVDICLTKNDCLGLIGSNGAGKTTLLRLMAGIYQATTGCVKIQGSSVTMFDLNYGSDEEASGYENIRIAGTVLGMSSHQIDNITQEIADFSELGDALFRPIRTYSSGMRVRLAFGLISSMKADILLIDEIIGVGDARFMQKASRRIREQIEDSNIVVLASHAENVLRDFCNKGIVLDAGKVLFQGNIEESLAFYNERQARLV